MIGKEELRFVREQARSFPGLTAPQGAEFIGTEEINGEIYYYYRYEAGFLYESKSGYEFKEHMHRIEQQNKRKLRIKKAGA